MTHYLDGLKKEDYINVLREYYKSINRVNPPKYEDYTINDFKKCIYLFRIDCDFINKVLDRK
jgi:hypothetical protein